MAKITGDSVKMGDKIPHGSGDGGEGCLSSSPHRIDISGGNMEAKLKASQVVQTCVSRTQGVWPQATNRPESPPNTCWHPSRWSLMIRGGCGSCE